MSAGFGSDDFGNITFAMRLIWWSIFGIAGSIRSSMALWRSHRIGRILRSIGISRRVGLRRRVRGSTHRPVVTRGACEHAPYATLPGIEPKAIAGNRREVGWCFGEVGGSRVGWRSFAGIKWPVQRVERQPADRRCPDGWGVAGGMGASTHPTGAVRNE